MEKRPTQGDPKLSPFKINPLHGYTNLDTLNSYFDELDSFLPASYGTVSSDLEVPHADTTYLEKELSVPKLAVDLLWMASKPMPPRPLHYQILLNRRITITEQMDMHLVWTKEQIFLKPLLRFLLLPRFWIDCLSCGHDCTCAKYSGDTNKRACQRRRLWKCALGFLFSYAGLIRQESDFYIAREMHLIPDMLTWSGWKTLIREILERPNIYREIDPRFIYGELPLRSLNQIVNFRRLPALAYISLVLIEVGSFVKDNLGWLASATAYIAIVLTSLQVGLATKRLSDNEVFQSASYGFTVFSVLGPLIVIILIFLVSCCISLNNWFATKAYMKKRLGSISMRSRELSAIESLPSRC